MSTAASPADTSKAFARLADTVQRIANAPRLLFLALALGWGYLIYQLSSRPPIDGGTHYVAKAWFSNLAHAPEYGVLAVLLALAFRAAPREGDDRLAASRWRVALLLSFLYGAGDELHQSFVAGRDASLCDVATDAAGAWLALGLLGALLARDRSRFMAVLAWGLSACAVFALCATFLGRLFPAWTWL